MLRLAWGLAAAACAYSQTFEIQPGRSFERPIAPGEIHTYSLDLRSDQLFRFFLRQVLPFEVTVKLTAANGGVIAERTSRQNILFSARIDSGAQYTLEIAAPKGSQRPSRYRVEHVEIRAALPDDDRVLAADADYTAFRRRAVPPSESPASKLDAAAALYEARKEYHLQGWALLIAGQYQVRASDYKQAEARYARSAAAFHTASDPEGRVQALDFLGDIRNVLRDYPAAREAAEESLRLSRELHLAETEVGALILLGRAYSGLGEKQRAIDHFQQGGALAKKLGDAQREAASLSAAAALHNSLGNREKALDLYLQALALQRARGANAQLDQAAALSNVGSTYASLGQKPKAAEYLEQAVSLFRSTGGGRAALATTLSDLAQLYLEQSQPERAEPLLEEALAIARENKNRWSEAYALMNIGRARRARGDDPGAAERYAAALAIQRELNDPVAEAVTRNEVALLERHRGNLEAAREHSAAAIDLTESVRGRVAVPELRSTVVASAAGYYDLHVDILMQLYRTGKAPRALEEARTTAERRRARNLVDVLAAAGISSKSPPDPELVARERKLRQDLNRFSAQRVRLIQSNPPVTSINAIDRQIDDTWTAFQSAHSKLLAADPLALTSSDAAALAVETIQHEVLDRDTVLLEYSLGEPRSYVWAISADRILGFELPARAEIESAARAYWESVRRPGSATAAAGRLSQLVLTPAAEMLAAKRVVIVADGALQYVPFGALGDPAQTSAYRPLLQTREVIEEPSASTLALLRRAQAERRPAPRTLAVFADPVFESDDPRVLGRAAPSPGETPAFLTRAAELRLGRLPATRDEGRTISALVPEPQRWLAMGFEANRAAATGSKLADFKILHFATHGVVETGRPELSALALSLFDAQGKPQDGFVRLYEIYGLKIQADLVVLSACDTALGKNVRGEGLIGLARGFMHAGAPRVVASLWKVDDQATSELMRQFYAAMLGPRKLAAGAALREAQLAVARQPRWRSPYYWAGFVLQGEWR